MKRLGAAASLSSSREHVLVDALVSVSEDIKGHLQVSIVTGEVLADGVDGNGAVGGRGPRVSAACRRPIAPRSLPACSPSCREVRRDVANACANASCSLKARSCFFCAQPPAQNWFWMSWVVGGLACGIVSTLMHAFRREG